MHCPLVFYFVWRCTGAGDVCLLSQDEEGPKSLYLGALYDILLTI
jgi:hypothetical protein